MERRRGLIKTHVGFRASEPMTEDQIRRSISINELRSRQHYIATHRPLNVTVPSFGGMGISLDLPVDISESLLIRDRIEHLLAKYRRIARHNPNHPGPNPQAHLQAETQSEGERHEVDSEQEEAARMNALADAFREVRMG